MNIILLIALFQGLVIQAEQHGIFDVIWEVPQRNCITEYKVVTNVTKYGLLQNKVSAQTTNIIGDVITLFYNQPWINSLWPEIEKNGTITNGGVPQAGNLTKHLEYVAKGVEQNIPNISFDGVGVIDFETWTPWWLWNSKEYKTLSISLVKNQHPEWSPEKIESHAKLQFERAAKEFFLQTLILMKKMRPNGRWGYYGYPRGDQRYPDEYISWLFNVTTAWYPSVYIKRDRPNFNITLYYERVQQKIDAVFRLKKTAAMAFKPVYFYIDFIAEALPYYPGVVGDLMVQMGDVADAGLNGVVIWGSDRAQVSYKACVDVRTYVTTILGPYVMTIHNYTETCSQNLCQRNGRCSLVNPSKYHPSVSKQQGELFRLKTLHLSQNSSDYFMYKCICYPGWKGKSCEMPYNILIS